MSNLPVPVVVFFGLFFALCLFSILKTEIVVNWTAKYFKWGMKLYGFEGEIKPTPKAIIICRFWNIFMLVIFSIFIFFIFSGRLK